VYNDEDMEFNGIEILFKVALFFPPFLFAMCFHEFAHGWAAKKFGDRTAEHMGRLTLNPIAHMDPLGTVILPIAGVALGGFVFGYAKPVPVNPRNLSKPKEQMFWIALAGPLSNILLGFVGAIVYWLMNAFTTSATSGAFISMLDYFLIINAMLAVFNLIPIHPLDGGKILARFLPVSVNNKLEEFQQYSSYILLAVLLLGGFRILWIPIAYLKGIFLSVTQILLSFLI
jgi:Zn-dependent protease